MNTVDISSSHDASKKLVVKNKMGIHARLVAMIVGAANKYNNTEVWIKKVVSKLIARTLWD